MSIFDKTGAGRLAPEWRDYKRRVGWFVAAWLGGYLIARPLPALLKRIAPGSEIHALAILLPAWIVWFVVAAFRFHEFKCPGCRKRFFVACWYNNVFARSCVHCGHPKWSGPPEDEFGK